VEVVDLLALLLVRRIRDMHRLDFPFGEIEMDAYQICSAYCFTVLSELNFPERIAL
jgi:hypothetical protein